MIKMRFKLKTNSDVKERENESIFDINGGGRRVWGTG